MFKHCPPAIDTAIASRGGHHTRDGQPLAYNRAASPDLAPWFGRIFVAAVDAPADHTLDCGTLNDTSVFCLMLKGRWQVQGADGPEAYRVAALLIGPHTRRMPMSVTGSFISVGAIVRPGAAWALQGSSVGEYVDRAVPVDHFGVDGAAVLSRFDVEAPGETLADVLEDVLREHRSDAIPVPDPLTARFEALAFTDPTASVSVFAKEHGVDRRTLERQIRRDFGMSPKQVLRRARALDMASHLRGVADRDEAEALALRYYDQSHLIRDFTELFGMSPRQFAATPQPLLTLVLESRQARRLEAIARIAPGQMRPWQ